MTLCTYLLSVAIPKCPIAALKQKIKGVRYEYGVDCSDCSVIDDDSGAMVFRSSIPNGNGLVAASIFF